MMTMPTRIILALMLSLLVLPAFAQESSNPNALFQELMEQHKNTEGTSLRQRAEQGYSASQRTLGRNYREGYQVPQDYLEAIKWLRLAAEVGDKRSQLDLGDMYERGQGVDQDFVQAHMWYNLAATEHPYDNPSGDLINEAGVTALKKEGREARSNVERGYGHRPMTRIEVLDAQKLAREWKRKEPTKPLYIH